MKKFTTIALCAVVALFAGIATADNPADNTQNVTVNVEVAANVSLWGAAGPFNIVLDGNDPNNAYSAAPTNISYIGNIESDIDVKVQGNVPAPTVPGGGIHFYIFDGSLTQAQVRAALMLNSYNPAGAKSWNPAQLQAGTTSYKFRDDQAVATSAASFPVTYAAATPGDLPLPVTVPLTVTWTISPAI